MSYFSSLADFWRYDFLLYSLVGTFLLSFICGWLSPLVLAKRYAFIGEGVSHSTLLGLAVALALLEPGRPMLLFAVTLGITLIGVVLLAKATFRQNLPSDSLIGIFLTTTLGAGVLVHTLFASGKSDLLSFLFGNILLLESWDIVFLTLLLGCIVVVIILPIKRWIYFAYDEQGAMLSGLPIKAYHYGLLILLTVLIVSAVKLAGTVLVNTLLLIPGALAYKIGRSMKEVFALSVSFSVLSSLLGITLANWQSVPPGATLSLTQFVLFLLVLNIVKLLRIRL